MIIELTDREAILVDNALLKFACCCRPHDQQIIKGIIYRMRQASLR